MREAIQKAIEGGYGFQGLIPGTNYYNSYVNDLNNSDTLFDPLFWQSLGKALWWSVTDQCWGCGYDEGATDNTPEWKVYWHSFIDHLAEGKDPEDFFKQLLQSN
jgi:hypothetical protein